MELYLKRQLQLLEIVMFTNEDILHFVPEHTLEQNYELDQLYGRK